MQHKEAVLSRTDSDIPAEIAGNNTARAYFGICMETLNQLKNKIEESKMIALHTAIEMDSIIRKYAVDNGKSVIDWQAKTNLIGKMKIEMEDYLIDEIKRGKGIPLTFDDIDKIIDHSVEVAKLWIK
jgi:type I restriction enzyme R subunit